ncbi:MAG: geranyl transferase [Gammaproteobacteria bacterium]|nr:geranyl transferase [Gammaproteobacteria bacterium]
MTRAWIARVEDKLDAVLPPPTEAPRSLHEAMRYSVLGGGKRIRPLLVYAAGVSLGANENQLDAPAAAIELMHAFSLVHDDLPAMDDDDLRRGRPTTHKAFDEATAILAADALQPLAFKVLADDAALNVEADTRLRMISLLASACGSLGMTGGQSIDLKSEGQRLDAAELEHMYKLKTGCLLEVSVLSGACAAQADESTLVLLREYADKLGLAFQICDDILDIEGATEVIGKTQGADVFRNKATWPALFGLDEAKRKSAELLDEALHAIEPLGGQADPLRAIGTYIVNRDR